MTEKDIDRVHDMFDNHFRNGKFGAANTMLAEMEMRLPMYLDEVLTALTASLPAKSKLPARAKLLERAAFTFGSEFFEGLE